MGLLDELAEIINPGHSPEIIGEINGRLAEVETAVGLANVAFESEQASRDRIENIAVEHDTLLKGFVDSPKNNVISLDEYRSAKDSRTEEIVPQQQPVVDTLTDINGANKKQVIDPSQQQMATEAREALERLHGARHDEGSVTVFDFRQHADEALDKAV
ncbi:hypothetical protein KC960_03350 [Candidatus Saccharibacteria bacterium]|nr:hypothetical protein [Candidatus Saccharibacteria bacterium]